MTDVRLVPMNRAQRDLFVNPQVPGDREAVMRELVSAWDAAPADPAEAANAALREAYGFTTYVDRQRDVPTVLRALGWPA